MRWLNRNGLLQRVGLVLPTLALALTHMIALPTMARAVSPEVQILTDSAGTRLVVDGKDHMVIGMNWGHMPIGQNYSYSLWTRPDDIIKTVLRSEMPLLQAMGVNTIRQYVGIPPKWVQFIYEKYGITTVLNHPVARYGINLDGTWIPNVDYSDPRLRAAVIDEIRAFAREFRNTPGLLMWLLGNENNYGLSWSSFEIEALPEGERNTARARHLYTLMEEATQAIKAIDHERPVAMANGDLQYIGIIAEECKSLDVFGTNVYRGVSVGGLFAEVQEKMGLPVLFTEFGSDAWNAKEMREDQEMQAYYLLGQWREIYEQASGKGGVGNAIGGLIFQWSDGWWKFRQTERLDIQDTNASWPNGGYYDFVEGDNNMNEEWWGIMAKGRPDHQNLYRLYPRAAYYALKDAFRLDPYAATTDRAAIHAHFRAINAATAALEATGSGASLKAETSDRIRLKGMRLEFETIATGGGLVTTPLQGEAAEGSTDAPAFRGFDQLQSVYLDFEAKPVQNVIATLSLNVLGNVPVNPIDEIFYENRGRTRLADYRGSSFELDGIERVKIYRADLSWDDRWFQMQGFYRSGHFHWGYEGDFFGLYREAFYGENLDIYNGNAPFGVEFTAKRSLNGLKVAAGPELWWGAKPAVLAKYQRQIGKITATAVVQEDFEGETAATTSTAIPVPSTRKATIHLETQRGPFGLELGGIWAGSTKVGDTFQIAEMRDGTYVILQDEVRDSDALGGKAKLTYQKGKWNLYAQGAIMGIVADGGPTRTMTFTGWHLKDSGSGNQSNFLTGLAYNAGDFQIAPNFLWQKPIVAPMPNDVPIPGRLRNVLDDPFAVRANRETVAGELLLSYDPTPETFMWAWDNIAREDAPLAASLSFILRDFKTSQDASIGIMEDGRTTFAFSATPPARSLWESSVRLVSKLRPDMRVGASFFAGEGEPNGDDSRVIERYGVDARIAWSSFALEASAKYNDWGPYDYHRDFNQTFPLQVAGDVSYNLGSPGWFGFPQTRFGLSGAYRTLDQYSPRYCPAKADDGTGNFVCVPQDGAPEGNEWEVRTYLHFAL